MLIDSNKISLFKYKINKVNYIQEIFKVIHNECREKFRY